MQGSIPQDHLVGDAGASELFPSPYNSAEWHNLYDALFGSAQANAWIIPGIGSNLAVTQRGAGANMSVDVASGEALVHGARYKSTATENLTVAAADPTNPRIDRIILRWRNTLTTGPQDIRLAVLTGVPAATPSLPVLTQTASIYEVPIAEVWVAAGVTSIVNAEIHDQRVFAPNLFGAPYLSQENLIKNSEFMGFSYLNTVTPGAGAPDGWTVVGTVTTWASATKPSQMSRGRAVSITAGAGNSGMSQTFLAKGSTVYAIRTLINVTAGDVGQIVVTDDGASPATITRNIRRTGSFIEETIYYLTPSDATTITVQLLALSNTDVVQYGQLLAVEGYSPGPFRQIHETIIFDTNVEDTNWNGDAKSTGSTALDFDTDFQGIILSGTRAILANIGGNDSGSAGFPVQLALASVLDNSTFVDLRMGGVPNDAVRVTQGWASLDGNNQVLAFCAASGALTLDFTIYIRGILV